MLKPLKWKIRIQSFLNKGIRQDRDQVVRPRTWIFLYQDKISLKLWVLKDEVEVLGDLSRQ